MTSMDEALQDAMMAIDCTEQAVALAAAIRQTPGITYEQSIKLAGFLMREADTNPDVGVWIAKKIEATSR